MVAKPQGFYQRLQLLPLPAQQAFMAALCERLLPNYALYEQTSGHGDGHTLRTVLNLVWERLSVPNASIDFARQAEKLAECEPPEGDESFGARRALDAVVSISALLDTLQGESPKPCWMSAAPRGLVCGRLSNSPKGKWTLKHWRCSFATIR